MGQVPIKLKTLKKLPKRDAYEAVLREMEDLVEFYFRNYTKQDVKDSIYARMTSKKHYARYIKHALKENENPFPDGFSFILVEFLSKYGAQALENEELGECCEIYGQALDKMNKTRAKHMAKDLDCPKDVAMEFALIYPGRILSKHNAWIFSHALGYRLAQVQRRCAPVEVQKPEAPKTSTTRKRTVAQTPAKEVPTMEDIQKLTNFNCADEKFIKNLYKGFFGRDEDVLIRVYANLFLDKASGREKLDANQKAVWDAVTTFVLNRVEKLPLKQIKNVVDMVTQKRARDSHKESDQKRRIVLSELKYEEYPKLVTVLKPDDYSFKDALKKEKKDKKKKKKRK